MSPNIRQLLHALVFGAAAISAGTVTFVTNPDAERVIAGTASLVVIVITAYLGPTTTGITKAQAKRKVEHLIEERSKRVSRRKA